MEDKMITQAMILAAGEGRRLRPLTDRTPKPLIQIGGKAMLDHALDQLAAVGVKWCVVNTYHLADQIQEHVKNRANPQVTISHETTLLDTGGGIMKALSHFGMEPFFVLNADIWWRDTKDSSLIQLNQFWDPTKMDALLLLVPVEKAIGYTGKGDYFLTPESKAHHRKDQPTAPYIFSGIRIIHPRLLSGQEVRPFSIMPLFHQAEEQGRLSGLIYDGDWGDIGAPESLKAINEDPRVRMFEQ